MLITNIEASAWIETLRLCYAQTNRDLLDGLAYYDLFQCDAQAEKLMSR